MLRAPYNTFQCWTETASLPANIDMTAAWPIAHLSYLANTRACFIDRHEVGQPNEFANWTDEELEAFIKSGTKPLGIAPGKTQH
jgi:hypothetical protein